MDLNDIECPCNGKGMSILAGPWILLTLHRQGGSHGYEIKTKIAQHLARHGIGMNITGIYRHLKQLEQRGMVSSKWVTSGKGAARCQYQLTANGRQCLEHWLQTLTVQMLLIGSFFEQARQVFPDVPLPIVKEQSTV
ncbi:MAG: helix-turn-helix transcriptional regulator [Desulfobacterales bacterium]